MFKITDYSELNGNVAMTIAYTINGKDYKDERIYATKIHAMRYFGSSAHSMLLLRISEFKHLIHKVSHHYFNNAYVPFIRDNKWTAAYWKYLELHRKLSKDIQAPHRYATKLLAEINLFEALIPDLVDLKRLELKAILLDITDTARKLIEVIEKLQDGTFSMESQNIAG